MFKLSWRSALAHKGRLALMMVAIALGVAYIVGTFVFTDTMKDAFNVLFEQEQVVDVVVRADTRGLDEGRVPEAILDDIEAVPGVELASPLVQGVAQAVDRDGNPIGGAGPPTLGFGFEAEGIDISVLVLREGRLPSTAGEVAIDAYSARKNDFALGDTIEMLVIGGAEEFTLVGTMGFGSADNLLGATLALFELEESQRVLGFDDEYTQIMLTTEPDADPETVRAAIEQILPEGTEAILGEVEIEEGKNEVAEGVGFFNTIFLVFGFIGMFVGAFLIQNTFRIVVAQRTRELAMMRAVGATGRQVTTLVILEAALVGLAAAAIGIGVGVLLAVGMRVLFDAIGFGFPSGSLSILPRTVIAGLLVGTLVTVFAAILPAFKAAKVPPVAALRETGSTYFKSLRRRAISGGTVLVLGITMVLLGLFGDLDQALLITGLGAGIAFLGVSVVAPLFARPFGRIFGAPLPWFFGVTGVLAKENSVRKPRRMAATASALMIGVALVAVVATLVASAKTTVTDTVREEVLGEYQVQVQGFTGDPSSGISPELARELRALPEVAVAATWRIGDWYEAGSGGDDSTSFGPGFDTRYLIGVDPDMDRVVDLGIIAGDFADLSGDSVMLYEDFATDRGLGVGDTLEIEYPDFTPAVLEVVAVFDGQLFGTELMIPMATFQENYTYGLDQMAIIGLAEGVDVEAVRPILEAVTDKYPNADLNNAEEYLEQISSQLDLITNMLYGLLAMAIVIALLGIANTLALSIMERKREIGLLRAVGMSRRQVRRMVRWEAVLIAVFGAVIGVVVGVLLGVAVVMAIGQGLAITIPWSNLVVYVVLGMVGGVIASIWPAWRGSRTDLLEAIHYE